MSLIKSVILPILQKVIPFSSQEQGGIERCYPADLQSLKAQIDLDFQHLTIAENGLSLKRQASHAQKDYFA